MERAIRVLRGVVLREFPPVVRERTQRVVEGSCMASLVRSRGNGAALCRDLEVLVPDLPPWHVHAQARRDMHGGTFVPRELGALGTDRRVGGGCVTTGRWVCSGDGTGDL